MELIATLTIIYSNVLLAMLFALTFGSGVFCGASIVFSPQTENLRTSKSWQI